jgi:DNA-binding MarR family transcriptional regulator
LQLEGSLSRATGGQLASWRVFLESAFALIDILDAELQERAGMSLRWYDVLVHLETGEGLAMNELAARILSSKSGLTRVVDRMEEAGLVRRERSVSDRRVISVFITDHGRKTMRAARKVHHQGIQTHFLAHLSAVDLAALAQALEKVREHVRPLRPGRVSG